MPRSASETFAVTLYLLEGVTKAERHLRSSYREREDFSLEAVQVDERHGFLLKGVIPKDRTNWVEPLGEWIADPELAAVGQSTAAAVLLIPTKTGKQTWALSFGMGLHAIEPATVVDGIGRKIAVRQADPSRLKSITHSRLDQRALIARTSIPGGDDLTAYGIGGIANLVSRVVTTAQLTGLHARAVAGSKPLEIRGADAIKVPLARNPRLLLKDLDLLEDILLTPALPVLAAIEQLHAVKKTDRRWPALQAKLDEALGMADQDDLGLSWPTESADIATPVSHFQVSGAPRGFNGDDEKPATLDTLLEPLGAIEAGRRVERLERMKVQAFTDEGDPISGALPAKRWIVFETSLSDEGGRYCLQDGRWYELDRALNDDLTGRTAAVFARPSPCPSLPIWDGGTEAEYNQRLAESLGGVNLDAKTVVCDSNRDGFEACDVMTPDGVFIHVKRVDKSAPLSHLLAQAAVSTQTLLQDYSAVEGLRTRVVQAGGNIAWVPERPRQVVLVMCRDREVNAETLYSFSRMRLVSLAEEFELWNVRLSVQWVERK